MSHLIDRNEVQRLRDEESAQIVEVLPAGEYESEHIAGAINIPLKSIALSVDRLDRNRPAIVYCYDYQ